MGDYEALVNLISNFGFPIVITVYLLHRFEKKIDTLVENINKLSNAIEKQFPKE
ncbi:YvrJ family protein [Sporosarcina luteola]|uniref:YvrJ family protein n=1 Tax=Bacillales TaxID=1385 RepID=UPI00203FCDBE|nr:MULTISPECIES: YvrJ family protein [Bacillales]MCM3638707.1 YvrJ family protein [Sporosarcina luteola]